MSSRGQIAQRQQNRTYRPNGQPAPHIFQETQFIDSQEPVLEIGESYWVASKRFVSRYYRVTVDEQGQWSTSSYSDERVAKMLVEMVKAYQNARVSA